MTECGHGIVLMTECGTVIVLMTECGPGIVLMTECGTGPSPGLLQCNTPSSRLFQGHTS
jgi:hypothetical protein